MNPPRSTPLPFPSGTISVTADGVMSGLPIPAIERIKIFSPSQWEDFVLEWADSLRDEYAEVVRHGGSGDMGCDIIGNTKNATADWDNFQCKHYKDPLAPNDIWIELGKLAYYSHKGEYSLPRKYYFVAPQGAGTTLSKLLKNPTNLRDTLLTKWNDCCRYRITSVKAIELDDDLRHHINKIDFSIFEAIPPLRIIDAHAKTRWHVARFGSGLPNRPSPPTPPTQPAPTEAGFVKELFAAYSDHLKKPVRSETELSQDHKEHFQDSRIQFYSAEALRTFSRDTLPPGVFKSLQDELHFGIKDEIRHPHQDGYLRVLAVVKTARTLPLIGHALISRMGVKDYGGICHQLANDGKVKWTR